MKTIDDYYYFELPMYTYFNAAFGDKALKLKYKGEYVTGEKYYKYTTKGNSPALVPKKSWLNPGNKLLNKLLKNDKEFTNYLFNISLSVIKLAQELEEINYKDLKENRNRDSISDFYNKYINVFPYAVALGYSLDSAYEEYSKQNIRPVEPYSSGESFIGQESRDLAQIFKVKNQQEQKNKLRNHMLRYSYILNNYAGHHAVEPSYFLKRKKEVLKKHLNKKYNTILKKPKNLSGWISFLGYVRDQRKKCNLLYISLMDRYLHGECRRLNLSYKNAVLLTPEEFEKQKKNKLKNYNGTRYVHYTRKGLRDISKKDWNSLIHASEELSSSVRGVGASTGIVKGRVKIIFSPADFKKINKGNVLLTSMTRPEFAPVLKKVAAIVTNEGGITCHAAIISREMNIPCVIATGKATKVFKDGDMVEVDANKGIVRKI